MAAALTTWVPRASLLWLKNNTSKLRTTSNAAKLMESQESFPSKSKHKTKIHTALALGIMQVTQKLPRNVLGVFKYSMSWEPGAVLISDNVKCDATNV